MEDFFVDFAFFWNAAQALLQGRDPYAVEGFYYPLPTLFLFVPFAVLPYPFALAAWLFVCLLVFVVTLKRRALLWVFFTPTLQAFGSAQVSPLILGVMPLLRIQRSLELVIAVALFKPHIILFAVPFLWVAGTLPLRTLAKGMAIYGLCTIPAFLLMPDWVPRWLFQAVYGHRPSLSPTLWGLLQVPTPYAEILGLVLVGMALLFCWRAHLDAATAFVLSLLVNPQIIPYDLILLTPFVARVRHIVFMIPLSFGVWWLSLRLQNTAPFFLLTLAVLIFRYLENRASSSHPAPQPELRAEIKG